MTSANRTSSGENRQNHKTNQTSISQDADICGSDSNSASRKFILQTSGSAVEMDWPTVLNVFGLKLQSVQGCSLRARPRLFACPGKSQEPIETGRIREHIGAFLKQKIITVIEFLSLSEIKRFDFESSAVDHDEHLAYVQRFQDDLWRAYNPFSKCWRFRDVNGER